MKNPKIILIPNADSPAGVGAKFTKGKRYAATAFTNYSGELLYKVRDDKGRVYTVYTRSSQYLGGHHFDIDYQIEDGGKRNKFADYDGRTIAITSAGICDGLINRACIIDPFHYDNHTEGDDTEPLLKYVVSAGIDWALSDATCESFMREPFSRIAELEKQVAFLTGELQAAHAKIEKVREIMRSEHGYDIEDHARVLRMMADAFAKLQQ
ncbi:hypothetical protein CPL00378_CDS0075 [Klebsiella phage AloofButler]